ncbi:LPP20 family lipoprotein [Thermodesulfobacteriota bacterium]
MKRVLNLLFALVIFAAFLPGCGKKTIESTGLQPIQDKAPKWVVQGSGAFNQDDEKIFYAVGFCQKKRNRALQWETADNRSRNAMAKVFEVYSASLSKDYMASTTDTDAESSEEHIEIAIRTVTKATLNGVTIIDHWQDQETGDLYSLAKLDMKQFMDGLNKMKELNAKVKEHIKANANKLHAELNDELKKENIK